MFPPGKILLALTVLWLPCGWNLSLKAQQPTPAVSPVAPANADLVTLSGQTYKNARVLRVEPDGINYIFAGGVVKIPFSDLPEETRKRYGYDAKAADAYARAEEQAQEHVSQPTQTPAATPARKKHPRGQPSPEAAATASNTPQSQPPQKQEPKALIDPDWQGGLKTFARLTVAEVIASPFTLKNALIEMTGIARIEPKEISEGVYKLTIWTADYDYVTAVLPAAQARLAETSKTLFVAVKDPSANPVKVTILGNATTYQGLSTMPTVVWH